MPRISMNRRIILATLCLSLVVVGATAGDGSLRPSAGCAATPPVAPGQSIAATLKVGDLVREYRLHLPTEYQRGTAVPLVLVIHGYTGTAEALEMRYMSFSRNADLNGYVAAYPQATGFEVDGKLITSWNDLACNRSSGPEGPICTDDADDYPTPPECGEPRPCDWCSCHDDVGFIAALLDELEGTLCIDLDRVYATGISNGAMFVNRLGCDLSDRFAAVAPVAGTLARGFNCAPPPSPKISLLDIYGTRDRVVPFDGSAAGDGFLYVPVAKVMTAWAGPDSQRCATEDTPYETAHEGAAEFRCVQRAGCASGAEVVSCSWAGDHDWPHEGEDKFAADVIWNFFAKNGR
jgi:polyhydroxybutyrate depolymerase